MAAYFTKTYLPICGLLLLAQIASAQTKHINFTSLSSKDGLVSNSINAILKDHYGLMWFATDDGLNKFDGTNFTVYRHTPGDSSGLRANEVLALHEDKRGTLWIGTSGGGLSSYDRRKDAFMHYPVGLTHNAVVRNIFSDHLGKIWVIQYDALHVFDPGAQKSTQIHFPIKTTFSCGLEDSQHRIWIGTKNGLVLYDRKLNTFKKLVHDNNDSASISSEDIRSITEDKSGTVWIGTADGLNRLHPDGKHFTGYKNLNPNAPPAAGNEINSIASDEDGLLWIGTSFGINVFNPQTQQVINCVPEPGNMHSLTSKTIRCGYADKQGIYWFGTFRGGINKYDKNLTLFDLTLSSTFNENRLSPLIVSAFAEEKNGNLFVGTDGGGLFELDRATQQVQPVHISLRTTNRPLSILSMQMTARGQLYIGTFAQGLLLYDPATGQYRQKIKGPAKNDLNANDVFCIKEDSKGQIWVGTNGAGVNVLKNNEVIAKYTPDPNGPNEFALPVNGFIRALEEDAAGNIWIGSHGGGIAVYHPANRSWTTYTQENNNLPSNKAEVLFFDSKGNMWVGTFGGGLSLFDKQHNRFINFSEKDGLQNTTIYQIMEDLQGQIWVSTNTGISRFDAATRQFRNYTSHHGVQNNNFVHGSGIRTADGALYFGGLQGFNSINPQQLTINHNVPVVLLSDLKISNKSIVAGNDAPIKEHISVADEIRLAFKQNFALSFVALNYTIPKQNRYAYKLEGFDKDWNYTGAMNTAYYTNLDPGEYVFHVKAANNDGVWSAKETVIKIFVRPPFWRTTWAYIFYILAIGALLLYSRYRGITRLHKKFALEQERREAKRVLELDRLKLKFLTNLSHDFRTPISLIMGPVDQLIAEEEKTNRLDKLMMVKRNARRLLNLVNQLLDFRKMEEHELKLQLSTGDFISFVKEVADSFKDLAERKNIRFDVSSELAALHVWFDRDKMERVLFNLLSNAFKFTLEGGFICIELQGMENNFVSIKVIDSGIGIPRDKKDQVFDRFFQSTTAATVLNQGTGIGLSITKEFIKMHGGTIDVESEPGKGCAFHIQIPLQPATELHEEIAPAKESTAPIRETKHLADVPTVLLVEDNEDFRFYLKDNLRNNYKVVEACHGKEGWQKALAHHPQLIVTDISMPQMDGIALLRKLKSDKRTSHIPVVVLTALNTEEQHLAGLETGANDYITKPFNFEVLQARIKNLLDLNHTLKRTYTKQIKVVAPEVKLESANEKLLNNIASYLEDNLTDSELSVESLCKQVGMSRTSLYNKLLELTGQTPVEYIRSYRLDRAASLMEKSNMTIAEIAYQVGFTTPNYFARSFKNRFNMLPSEFVARIRKGNSDN